MARLSPRLILVALALLFFADLVLHPTQVLYSDHSDLLALHVPLKRFLVRSWHDTGAVPLWCPYSYAGMPFVHDVQVAAFYPLHFPLYLLPEERIGAALSWLIVVHVIVAGGCMHAYARSQGLGPTAALVAALGYMFAGKWMLHLLGAGHYITVGLAWLPLVVLGLEQAIRRGSLLRATWAGAAYALVVLGTHPQWTLYAGLFIALWTLGPALERAGYLGGAGPRSWRRTAGALGWWLGCGVWTALVAATLAAIQLLPSLEAAAQSSRAVAGMPGFDLLETLLALVGLAGPSVAGLPNVVGWEFRSGLGVVWITAAVLAPVLARGRVRFQAAVCLVLVVFALGGAAVVQHLPGFRLFRLPARMFLIAALPVALLAGTTTQALIDRPGREAARRRIGRRILLEVVLVALVSLGGEAFMFRGMHQTIRLPVYWVSLLVTVPAAFWLLGGRSGTGRWSWRVAWVGVLLADLWALAWPLVAVRPTAAIYAPSQCVRYLMAHNQGHGRVLDRDLPGRAAARTPLGPALPILFRIEPVRGYNPLDIYRFKQYVQFISDRDQPPEPHELSRNFPIKNQSLLDLLGTRYLVQPTDPRLQPQGEPDLARDPRWRKVDQDPRPSAYLFIAGGIQQLPSYSVYENRAVFPRAFVVPRAAPLPDRRHVLQALKATDFHRRVLLEDFEPGPGSDSSAGEFRPATIVDYRPNRIVVEVTGDTPGYLVLADLWYPGWTCTVDGRPARLHRADFVFRAAAVPAGTHRMVFRFAPASYRWGKLISGGALAAVMGLGLLTGGTRWSWKSRAPRAATD